MNADRAGPAAVAARLLQGLAQIGRTRLELARLELEAERDRLLRVLLRAALGLLLGALALAMGALWCVLRAPPQDRASWAGGLALAFAGAAAAAAWSGRRAARCGSAWLSTQWLPAARGRPGRGTLSNR